MKVLMTPHIDSFKTHESGIRRVVEAYFHYLPDFGVELVEKDSEVYDLRAVHAGMTGREADVAHLHGMYWTADYAAPAWEYHANELIVQALRNALQVTVPSPWVQKTIQRDMRFSPTVVPHGIEWTEWDNTEKHEGYILWNKNRNIDVCDPTPAIELAKLRSSTELVTTYLPFGMTEHLSNVRGVGLMSHGLMKRYIQRAQVYLSTTKETFGIGVLEAMASGVPTLAFDWGGNKDLIEHGVNGYLARPNDIKDLAEGLDYCIRHREMLGDNAREMSKRWDWLSAVEILANVYKRAMMSDPYAGTVSVVIPCFNYAHTLERAVQSVLKQTYQPAEIIIVDDGSSDDTPNVGRALANQFFTVRYIQQTNAGVATARNAGISSTQSEYICCLDADDQLEPKFLEACVTAIQKDRTLGIVYTGLMMLREDGKRALSPWPINKSDDEPWADYDKQLLVRSPDDQKGANQIPTCNVFRREAWARTGGYKQRYAPLGAGAEDGELWARIMSIGYGARKIADAGLFVYDLGGRVSVPFADGSIDKALLEPDWLAMHPWASDEFHPFASRATPKMLSHPVRQYDQPDVSVIIPVGPGHEKQVENALDSIESQTFRRWEVVIAMDTGLPIPDELLTAYPYLTWVDTGGEKGAGFARNLGRKFARAPFLVFLDADDSLAPTFLMKCIENWRINKTIGYTDYLSKSIVKEEDLGQFNQDDIVSYLPQKEELVLVGRSAEYDCERAQVQPSRTDFFHWCLVTAFIPATWHDRVGGFNEKMQTFEDVLYHWALARHGYCYTRIQEPLVVYRMHTGNRREIASMYTDEGKKNARNMLEYSKEVLERIKAMPCKKCPGGQPTAKVNVYEEMNNFAQKEAAMVLDTDMIEVKYMSANKGNHHVIGMATKTRYGYRAGGAILIIHRDDLDAQPHLFRETMQNVPAPVESTPVTEPPVPVAPIMPPEPEAPPIPTTTGELPEYIAPAIPEVAPESAPVAVAPTVFTVGNGNDGSIVAGALQPLPEGVDTYVSPVIAGVDDEVDLEAIPGITAPVAEELRARKLTTKSAILALGLEGLLEIPGIGETRAEAIVTALSIDARDAVA